MRADLAGQQGSSGTAAVWAAFTKLGWGPAFNSEHDLGTDLWVQARDQRLFDIGALVGVQIKSGSSQFREPGEGGWWFRDRDKRHTNYWVAHDVPHLLVLHNPADDECHWVHVTADAVIDTGKGSKILVPERNLIDRAHREALLAIATSRRSVVPWEGSAWSGAMPAPTHDRLRYALLVPRLVAPHPNQGHAAAISAAQAAALLMQGRLRDFHAFAKEHEEVPSLVETSRHEDPAWRFVGALTQVLVNDDLSEMREIMEAASDESVLAAATVVVAVEAITSRDLDYARSVLDGIINRDTARPVDHGWLRLQRARCLGEAGDERGLREDALAAYGLRNMAPDDVTATAISGVAARMLFGSFTDAAQADFDLSRSVEGADTAVSWWRTQGVAGGLGSVVERLFAEWAGWSGDAERATNQLSLAALSASLLGDQGRWRYLAALSARNELIGTDRRAETNRVARAIGKLRAAGDEKALRQAVEQACSDGPAQAVRVVSESFTFEDSTSSTIIADLAFCEFAGDFFSPATASAAADWIVGELRDPKRLLSLTQSRGFSTEVRLVETLTGLAATLPSFCFEQLLARLPTLHEANDSIVRAWRNMLYELPKDLWDVPRVSRLAPYAVPDRLPLLGLDLLGIVGAEESSARQELRDRAAAGSLRALVLLGTEKGLTNEQTSQVFVGLRDKLDQRREAAAARHGNPTLDDAGCAMVSLLAESFDERAANSLLGFLEDALVPRDWKRGAIAATAVNFDRLGEDFWATLSHAFAVVDHLVSPMDRAPWRSPDITAEASTVRALRQSAPADPQRRAVIGQLLAGSARHRQWASFLASKDPDDSYKLGVMSVLLADRSPWVRTWAARRLTRMSSASETAEALAVGALRDPGRAVPAAVVFELLEKPAAGAQLLADVQKLTEHPSAVIRRAATQVSVAQSAASS